MAKTETPGEPKKEPALKPPNRWEKASIWTNLFYMLRVPILCGTAIFLLPLTAKYVASSLLRGLYDLAEAPFWSTLWFSLFTFTFAWSVMTASKLILYYGLQRLAMDKHARVWFRLNVRTPVMKRRLIFWVCLAGAVLCISGIFWVDPNARLTTAIVFKQIAGITCGFVIAFGLLFAADALQSFLYEAEDAESLKNFLFPFDVTWLKKLRERNFWKTNIGEKLASFLTIKRNGVERFFIRIANRFRNTDILSRGYFRQGEGLDGARSASAHITAFVLFLVFAIVYFFVGYALNGILIFLGFTTMERSLHVPAITYIPILAALLCWFLASLTFFFDAYRIPLILPVLFWLFAVSWGQGHFYRTPDPVADTAVKTVADKPVDPKADEDYVIVVTADGGGIQATAWTAKVLTGIEKECRARGIKGCSGKIRLVSSVSGGSVGAMYFLDAFTEQGIPDAELDKVVNRAKSSSLSSVAWGLAYSDFLNSINPIKALVPAAYSPFSDRGDQLEKAWAKNKYLGERPAADDKETGLNRPLSAWKPGVDAGWRPAVVFNGTIVETGERFLMTNADLLREGTDTPDGKRNFYDAYPGRDIPITTAARLSASFPFVTPVASAKVKDNPLSGLHIADGGYYDNYGISSAMEWIEARMRKENAPKKVIVVQIRCGVRALRNQSPVAKAGSCRRPLR